MPIDDHLLRDESILATANAIGATLFATNKRIIRYEKGFLKEKVDSLYYSHITGASYEQQSHAWLIVGGILSAIFGFVFFGMSNIRYIGGFLNIVGLVLLLVGALAIVVGIYMLTNKPAWYQIKAVGLDQTNSTLWRTSGADTEARTFARFIQDQISQREMPIPPPPLPTTREREVITREIVMVKCDYCGGLIPQTAIFCPNCGAKTK